MKIQLTQAEKRRALIHQARAKYISTGKTKNISEAFKWLLEAYPKFAADNPLTLTARDSIPKFGRSRPAVIRLTKEQRLKAYENVRWGRRKPCRGQTPQPKGDN